LNIREKSKNGVQKVNFSLYIYYIGGFENRTVMLNGEYLKNLYFFVVLRAILFYQDGKAK
jgi:hypothetical protein